MFEPRRLKALKFIGKLGNSYNKPFLVLAEDGNLYVTKPNTIHRGDLELLAAESIATELARLLGLPVPDWAIIEITTSIDMNSSPPVPDSPLPGEYFGSRYLANAMTLADSKRLRMPRRAISNESDAPKCLVFDALVENADRHENNVMLALEGNEVRVYLIDHGHVLGGHGWPALGSPAHSKLYKGRSPDTLAKAFGVAQGDMVEKAKALCPSLTTEAIGHMQHLVHLSNQIPAFWWNGKPSDTFTSFLQKRAPHMHDLLD